MKKPTRLVVAAILGIALTVFFLKPEPDVDNRSRQTKDAGKISDRGVEHSEIVGNYGQSRRQLGEYTVDLAEPTRHQRAFRLLEGGKLSFAARRELGLSDIQCSETNQIISRVKDEIQTEMIKRLKRDPLFDRPDKRGESYSIEAFPDIHSNLISRAIADLGEVVPGDLPLEIAGEIEQSSMFLGAGANDVMLTLNPEVTKDAFSAEGQPREGWFVTYSLLDPITGRRKAGGVIDFSKFNSDFMHLFEASPGDPN